MTLTFYDNFWISSFSVAWTIIFFLRIDPETSLVFLVAYTISFSILVMFEEDFKRIYDIFNK